MLRPLRLAEQADVQLRLELQLAAAVCFEGSADFRGREGARVERVPSSTVEGAGGRFFAAVGAVEGEVLAVDVDEDRADVELGAPEDIGDVARLRVDLRGLGVEEEGYP